MSNETLQSDLGMLCRKIIDEHGWTQFRDFDVVVMPDMSQFGAHITLDEWKIRVIVGADYYDAVDTLLKQEKLPVSRDKLIEQMLYFTMGHEHGHFVHAPKTQEDLHRILKGVYEAIHERETDRDKVNSLCFYIHNMFTDTILNTVNAHTDRDQQRYREGMGYMYLLMGNYTRQKLGPLQGKGDKAFTLFLKSNYALCDIGAQFTTSNGKYLTRWFPGFNRYHEKLIDIFTNDLSLTRRTIGRDLDEEGTYQILARMQDTSLWEQMSFEYASLIYPFIRQQQSWMQSSQSRKSPPQPPQEGGGTSPKQPQKNNGKKPESEKDAGGGQQKPDSKDKKGDKEIKSAGGGRPKKDEEETVGDKLNRKADEFLQRLLSDANNAPYSSPFLQQFKRLDNLYRQRAGRLTLFAEDPNTPSPHHELYVGTEEIPLGEFRSGQVDWSSTRISRREDGKKQVHLYRKAIPLSFPMEVEEKPGGIPDISWIFDSSTSMDFEPFEGDGKGEYHFAALAVYSMLRYLEETGLAPLLNYNLINFFARTTSSGWRSYDEMPIIKRTLFDYQGSGTVLDSRAIAQMRTTRRDNAISFMLTDTEFNFPDNEKVIIKEIDRLLADGGVGLYLFHLGGRETTFSKAMKERGVPVHPVKTAHDFMEAGLQFTKDLYGEIVNESRL